MKDYFTYEEWKSIFRSQKESSEKEDEYPGEVITNHGFAEKTGENSASWQQRLTKLALGEAML